MGTYKVQVTELVANVYVYTIEADSAEEALEKASSGEIEYAEFIEVVGVVDRVDCQLVEEPD